MKSKQSRTKLETSLKSIELSCEGEGEMLMERNDKFKKELSIIDPTIASFSENEISTAFLNNKPSQTAQSEECSEEENITLKKSRKSNKKKQIEKNIILRSRDRNGKSSRISKNKEDKRRRRLERKAQKLKEKLKREKLKQKQIQQKQKPPTIIPKITKLISPPQKEEKINLDDCAEIKHLGFDRKQLQKKRDDLIKRMVEDWQWIEKSRSNTRELRTLNL